MRLLLDANLSPKLVTALREAGYDADHVADLGLLFAADEQIFERAATDQRTVVTADTDFSMMLALRGDSEPVGRPSSRRRRADVVRACRVASRESRGGRY